MTVVFSLPAHAQISKEITEGLNKIGDATGLKDTKFASIPDTISFIFNLVITFSGVIFLIILLFGGVTYLVSAGNEDGTAKAKKMMINAFVGLLITLAAWGAGTFILHQVGYTGVPGADGSGSGSGNERNWVKFKAMNSSSPGSRPVLDAFVEIEGNLKGQTQPPNGETSPFQITNPQSTYSIRVYKSSCPNEHRSNEPLDLGTQAAPSLRTIIVNCT